MATTQDFLNFFSDKAGGNPLKGSTLILTGNILQDMENNNIAESEEGYAFMGLAYTAAETPGSTITKDYRTVNDIVITAKFPRNYVPTKADGTPAADGEEIHRAADSRNGEAPSYLGPRDNERDWGDYSLANAARCPDPEARMVINVVAGGRSIWKTWFFDLLGASQVKDLTRGHFSSYAAWRGSPNLDGSLVENQFPKIVGGMPQIPVTTELREAMSAGKWTEYRLNFATTVGLLMDMLRDCPPKYLTVFGESTINAVKIASNQYWSEDEYRKIPTKALGILYAYLMATDQMVGNLWGPERAYKELSLVEKESLKNWFADAMKEVKAYRSGVLMSELPGSLKAIGTNPGVTLTMDVLNNN